MRLFSAAFFTFFCTSLWSQVPSYEIRKSNAPVEPDGNLNEAAWLHAQRAGGFIQHFPYDTSKSKTITEFMLTYDDEALYAAFICYDRNPEKPFVIQNLKRDFSITNTDAVILTLSPFLDGQNGFSFGVSPENSQREGVVENGGNFGVTTAWDQIWYSAVRKTRDTWFAEFKVPFSSIRFSPGETKWSVNVARADFKNNEVSTWVKTPRNFNISQLSFCGPLLWDAAPERKGANIALIPYVSTLSSGTPPYESVFSAHTPRVGMDAKVALTSSLNMDVTVNPDFAQVDVDVQQINLTRFSLFFPERRQFFIENSDLFANFGFRQIRPFFSRKIGLGNNGNIPIDAGIRITGKAGNNWRLGVMDVQTRGIHAFDSGSRNIAVVALQRKVFTFSNIGFILVNNADGSTRQFGQKPNAVTGLEYNLQSNGNKWVGKAFIQRALGDGIGKESWSHATFLIKQTLNWSLMWNHEYVGKDFKANTGFVPRIENYDPLLNKVLYYTYWRLEPQIKRVFYPKSKLINNYNISLYNSSYYDSIGGITESHSTFGGGLVMQNSSEFRATVGHNYHNLFVPFIPVRNQGFLLMGAWEWLDVNVGFTSNNRKVLNGIIDVSMGRFYNGTRAALNGSLQFRRQPWGVFSLSYRREQIDLGPTGASVFNLLGLKADISFTTNMYFTTFLQYNTQSENVNMNLRFQWRYSPLSDFFIVYSENYLPTEIFPSKNRSLAFKFVYWFNT